MNNWERASCSAYFRVSSKARLGKAFPQVSGEQSLSLARCKPLLTRHRKQGTTKDTGELILWQERWNIPWKHNVNGNPKSRYPYAGYLFLWGMVCVMGKSSWCPDSWSGSQEKAVTCSGGYSHWMFGHFLVACGLRLFFLMSVFLPRALAGGVQSWLPSFVSSSYFALQDDEKLLENTFSIFVAVSFVAWLPCALVQRIMYCSSWMFTFPFLSAHMLGSAAPTPKHTQATAPHAIVHLQIP